MIEDNLHYMRLLIEGIILITVFATKRIYLAILGAYV
jgi:hypothetical protein